MSSAGSSPCCGGGASACIASVVRASRVSGHDWSTYVEVSNLRLRRWCVNEYPWNCVLAGQRPVSRGLESRCQGLGRSRVGAERGLSSGLIRRRSGVVAGVHRKVSTLLVNGDKRPRTEDRGSYKRGVVGSNPTVPTRPDQSFSGSGPLLGILTRCRLMPWVPSW